MYLVITPQTYLHTSHSLHRLVQLLTTNTLNGKYFTLAIT